MKFMWDLCLGYLAQLKVMISTLLPYSSVYIATGQQRIMVLNRVLFCSEHTDNIGGVSSQYFAFS